MSVHASGALQTNSPPDPQTPTVEEMSRVVLVQEFVAVQSMTVWSNQKLTVLGFSITTVVSSHAPAAPQATLPL